MQLHAAAPRFGTIYASSIRAEEDNVYIKLFLTEDDLEPLQAENLTRGQLSLGAHTDNFTLRNEETPVGGSVNIPTQSAFEKLMVLVQKLPVDVVPAHAKLKLLVNLLKKGVEEGFTLTEQCFPKPKSEFNIGG
jgi:hypothetical protein